MDNFMKEAFDLKRFMLLNIKKIWMVVFSMIVSSLLFGIFYFGKEVWLKGPDQYRTETLYYITFDRDQVENIHDYYNDYTWNEVLDSDKIAGEAAKLTGLTKTEIAQATEIPTMSDIRFIWVFVTTDSQQKTDKIKNGIETALLSFATNTPGFTSIEIYDEIPTALVEQKVYLVRWFVFGAILGLVVGILYLFYENAIDDSMYVESDVEKRFGILCAGVITSGVKNTEEEYLDLKSNLSKYCLKNSKKDKDDNKDKEIVIAFAEGYENAQSDEITEELLQNMLNEIAGEVGNDTHLCAKLTNYVRGKERDYFMELRKADYIIWMVPFGKNDGTRLDRAWKNLQFWSCKPSAAIITEVSKKYYRSYYLGQLKKIRDKK